MSTSDKPKSEGAKPGATTGPAKPDPATRNITAEHGTPVEPIYAREIVSPSVSAAHTLRRLQKPAPDELTIDALVSELESQAKAVNDGDLKRGETMLVAQAHALDAIFNDVTRRAQSAELLSQFEAYSRVSLKAQSQCRATWETLSTMKNPAPVAFVRQANIAAGPQQINNGPASAPSRTRENANPPNELTEAMHGQLHPNPGTSAPARGADPQMATVGEVDRTKDPCR